MIPTLHPALRLALFLLLAPLLGGCPTYQFSELQRSYGELVTDQSRYRGRDLTEQEAINYDDIQNGFFAVAKDAEPLITKQSEIQTQIAVARLSAVAAAFAGPQAQTTLETASSTGLTLCKTLATRNKQAAQAGGAVKYGAPRDCALLSFAGSIAMHEAAWQALWPVRSTKFDTKGPIAEQAVAAVAAHIADMIILADQSQKQIAAIKDNKDGEFSNLNPLVLTTLENYRTSFACLAYTADSQITRLATHASGEVQAKAKTLQLETTKAVGKYGGRDALLPKCR